MIDLPAGVRALAARGPAWERWTEGVAAVAEDHLRRWELLPDGAPVGGSSSLVQPVRTANRVAAVLKIGFPDADSELEHLVLRRWAGDGAVRLLRADPHDRVVLLERLPGPSLEALPDGRACEIVAGLLRRLHVPPLPQLRSLADLVPKWTAEFGALPRNAPIPRRLVEQAITLGTDLVAGPADANRVLHGDLHYGKVWAGAREPWLAVAPRPLNGDPHYELAPMLLHRWDELAGHVRDGVRFRFHTLVDGAGLDEDRARAWVIVRVVHEATRELTGPTPAGSAALTRYVALAKAVQD